MKKLLDFDPVTRTSRFFHFDELEEKATIETVQDVSATMELTQAEFNQLDERVRWKDGMNHVARIPLSEVAKLQALGVWYDDAALKRYLNDRDNKKLRSRPGYL